MTVRMRYLMSAAWLTSEVTFHCDRLTVVECKSLFVAGGEGPAADRGSCGVAAAGRALTSGAGGDQGGVAGEAEYVR